MKAKKQFVFLLCYLGLYATLAAQSFQINLHKNSQLYDFFSWQADQKPLVSAHRGGPTDQFPENCLATFEHTLSIAPALIECDVMLTKDSVPILMHDRTLDRTTNLQGYVIDYTWEELKHVRLKNRAGVLTDYPITTLEEVLAWAEGKTILKLDVKNNLPPEQVVTLIRKYEAMPYVVVITYKNEDALAYHALAPELMLSVSPRSEEDIKALLEAGVPNNNLIAFVGVDDAPQTLIDYLHNLRISCVLGTMRTLDARARSEEGYKVYLPCISEKNIDVLATDEVLLTQKAIEQFTYKRSGRAKYFGKW